MKQLNQEGRESHQRVLQKTKKSKTIDHVVQENQNTDPSKEKEETAQSKKETETDLTNVNPIVEQERQKAEADH